MLFRTMPDSLPPKSTSDLIQVETAAKRTLTADVDDWLAGPMWCVTFLWLVCLAGGLQHLRGATTLPAGTNLFWWGMLLLWPIYVVELAVHALAGSRNLRFNVFYVLLPPLRLGGRDHATWSRVWLPGALWQTVDRDLVARVEKATSLPMVGFALLVLPLLAVEIFWDDLIRRHMWLKFIHDTTSSVIWLAFASELIVMASIVRRKAKYLARHWIDLAIVLLPMVEALPALRLATLSRLARVGRLGRLSSLGRLSRVYRTRGLALRAFRALLLLDSVQRLLRLNPEKRLAALHERLEDLHYEIDCIRFEMRELETRVAAEKEAQCTMESAAAGECGAATGQCATGD